MLRERSVFLEEELNAALLSQSAVALNRVFLHVGTHPKPVVPSALIHLMQAPTQDFN